MDLLEYDGLTLGTVAFIGLGNLKFNGGSVVEQAEQAGLLREEEPLDKGRLVLEDRGVVFLGLIVLGGIFTVTCLH